MARIKIDLPETFPYSTEIPVRITDINYGRHLANDAVVGLLHEARLRFLRHYGFSEEDAGGAGVIAVDVAVTFKGEVYYGTTLKVEVAIGELHRHGFEVLYRLSNKETGKEVARAKSGLVFFDYAAKRILRMPEAFRRAFATE